jgi:hypothetical protein
VSPPIEAQCRLTLCSSTGSHTQVSRTSRRRRTPARLSCATTLVTSSDLVRAVIAYQTDITLDRQRRLLDHLDSFEALSAWRDGIVAMQESNDWKGGCAIGSMASELAEADPESLADLVESFERWEAPIRGGLRKLQERGELRPQRASRPTCSRTSGRVGGRTAAHPDKALRPPASGGVGHNDRTHPVLRHSLAGR